MTTPLYRHLENAIAAAVQAAGIQTVLTTEEINGKRRGGGQSDCAEVCVDDDGVALEGATARNMTVKVIAKARAKGEDIRDMFAKIQGIDWMAIATAINDAAVLQVFTLRPSPGNSAATGENTRDRTMLLQAIVGPGALIDAA